MSAKKLTFYFDYISPNAYLAWSQLPQLQAEHDLDITITPVLFTGLLRAHGQMGPAEQPAKRRWMSRNIARKAALLGLPLSPPKHHPYNPLMSLRVSSVTLEPEQRWALVDAFMKGIWVEGLHPSEASDVRKIIEAANLDADSLLAASKTPEVSDALKAQTQEAIDQGIFGIPSIIYNEELFFGYDDFSFLDMALRGEDPLTSSEQAKQWMKMRWNPSSMRKEVKDKVQDMEYRKPNK